MLCSVYHLNRRRCRRPSTEVRPSFLIHNLLFFFVVGIISFSFDSIVRYVLMYSDRGDKMEPFPEFGRNNK